MFQSSKSKLFSIFHLSSVIFHRWRDERGESKLIVLKVAAAAGHSTMDFYEKMTDEKWKMANTVRHTISGFPLLSPVHGRHASGSRDRVEAELAGRQLQANICRPQYVHMTAQSFIGDLARSLLTESWSHYKQMRYPL
jgi:hypothetical protein